MVGTLPKLTKTITSKANYCLSRKCYSPSITMVSMVSITMVFNTSQKCLNFLCTASRPLLHQTKRNSTRLSEVGVLENPKLEGVYATGQLLLHRIFGYRGIVLIPWRAHVFESDVPVKGETAHDVDSVGDASNAKKDSLATNIEMYYSVLIDSRDYSYIRAPTESVTFLGNQEKGKQLYTIPGLDYVSHVDVMPYSSNEKSPINNELFDRFLSHDAERQPPFVGTEALTAWEGKYHPWLELKDVHRETTEDIRVTVIPFFMGSRNMNGQESFWWRYCIRLENLGDLAVQLRERNFRIFSQGGTLETVRGRGVTGREPVLSKWQPAFQYSSHVEIHSPSGHMWGTFKMEREDGFTFDCKIPNFHLKPNPVEPGHGPNGGTLQPNGGTLQPLTTTPPAEGGSIDLPPDPEDGGSKGSFPFFMW